MFSKLTMSLAVTMGLLLANNAIAQTKKAAPKKAASAKAVDSKKAEESRAAAAAAANKKAEEEKALEEKRLAQAKAAAEKAEESATNTGVLGYMKSHFSASYHGEYYFQRTNSLSKDPKDRELQNFRVMHNPTIIYRPVKNYKVLATTEFKYSDNGPYATFINRHYRSLVLLTRENILTEKENGIKMDVSIGRRIFDRNHSKASSYGNSRINTNLSKKFMDDKLATSLLVQYLRNDPASHKLGNGSTMRIKPTTWKHSLELIPTINFQITDKLSYLFNDDFILNTSYNDNNYRDLDFSHEMNIGFVTYQFNDKNAAYFQLKYLRFSNPAKDLNVGAFQAKRNTDDWFEYYIGYIYNITPKFTVTGEVGSKLLGASDGRDGLAKEIAYPEFALYLDITL